MNAADISPYKMQHIAAVKLCRPNSDDVILENRQKGLTEYIGTKSALSIIVLTKRIGA